MPNFDLAVGTTVAYTYHDRNFVSIGAAYVLDYDAGVVVFREGPNQHRIDMDALLTVRDGTLTIPPGAYDRIDLSNDVGATTINCEGVVCRAFVCRSQTLANLRCPDEIIGTPQISFIMVKADRLESCVLPRKISGSLHVPTDAKHCAMPQSVGLKAIVRAAGTPFGLLRLTGVQIPVIDVHLDRETVIPTTLPKTLFRAKLRLQASELKFLAHL